MTHDFPHEPLRFRAYPPDEMQARARALADELMRRRTVRDFTDQAVPRAFIESAIDAARHAPSGANHQPWQFVGVADPAVKARVREAVEISRRT